jgi:hypothetical protein
MNVIIYMSLKVWFDLGKGPEPSREKYGAMIDKLKELHPGWEIKTWGKGNDAF